MDQQTAWVNTTSESYRGAQNNSKDAKVKKKLIKYINKLRTDSGSTRTTIAKYVKNLKAAEEAICLAKKNYQQVAALTAQAEVLEEHARLLQTYIGADNEPTPAFWRAYEGTKDKRSWLKELLSRKKGKTREKRGAEIDEAHSVSSGAKKRRKGEISSQIASTSQQGLDFSSAANPPEWPAPLESNIFDLPELLETNSLVNGMSDVYSYASSNFLEEYFTSNPPSGIYSMTGAESDNVPGLVNTTQDQLVFQAGANSNVRSFMGNNFLGNIAFNDVPQTSSLDPPVTIPYGLLAAGEESAEMVQEMFDTYFDAREDDVIDRHEGD